MRITLRFLYDDNELVYKLRERERESKDDRYKLIIMLMIR